MEGTEGVSAKTRGIIVGTESDKLIVEASLADVRRYSSGDTVQVERRDPFPGLRGVHRTRVGALHATGLPPCTADLQDVITHGVLYDRHGQVVCAIEQFSYGYDTQHYDVTAFGDTESRYVAGRHDGVARIDIRGRVRL